MNGEGHNRRDIDPLITQIGEDLSNLTRRYETHVTREDDTSLGAQLRKNMPVLLGLVIQAIAGVWWFSGFVGQVQKNQELTNLKLSYLEKQVSDWYSKSDALRDMALRDSVDNEIKRRIDALENNINGRPMR